MPTAQSYTHGKTTRQRTTNNEHYAYERVLGFGLEMVSRRFLTMEAHHMGKPVNLFKGLKVKGEGHQAE